LRFEENKIFPGLEGAVSQNPRVWATVLGQEKE